MTLEASMPADVSARARAQAQVADRSWGLPWIDVLTLFAIGLVVVLVSLPRLRSFALRENELDAMHMLRTLSSQPAAPGVDARECNLAALLAPDPALRRKLEDLELLADGRVRRHGYLFDLVLLGPGQPMLRAWPWNHAQTGRAAFAWTPERGLLGFENKDGRFSGPEHPPWVPEAGAGDENWVRMARR
jgi:hypothetical protein